MMWPLVPKWGFVELREGLSLSCAHGHPRQACGSAAQDAHETFPQEGRWCRDSRPHLPAAMAAWREHLGRAPCHTGLVGHSSAPPTGKFSDSGSNKTQNLGPPREPHVPGGTALHHPKAEAARSRRGTDGRMGGVVRALHSGCRSARSRRVF